MRRFLVVANQTLAGEPLLGRVRQLARDGPCAFHVVVPATPPQDHAWTEGEARAIARRRLDTALSRFGELGEATLVDGEVGDASPILAIEDAIRGHGPFDAIVLSTLPPGASRWLKLDLPHRVEAAFGLPVLHVIGEPERIGTRD
jgi:hypothetical protein